MKTLIKILSVGVFLYAGLLYAEAQPFERAERRNFWNAGHNVAGLRTDSLTVSTARIFGNYEEGGFRDTNMPVSSWRAGAEAKTITHLKRFSMDGSFSFEHFTGKGMCGSMSSRPGYYPVDVFEFTPGTKTMQTYSVNGGIAVDLNEFLVLGGGLDYMARNYTKRKDLRHTSWLMDMTVSAGLLVKLGRNTSVGVSYFYGKNSEKITAEELGISSVSYYAFLDKGMMYGLYDIWSGSGTHLKESGVSGFPTHENRHGAALQVSSNGFFAEAEYAYGRGRTGEKEVLWFDFPSHELVARLGWQFGKESVRHFLRASGMFLTQRNSEAIIGRETENGVTTTVIYGINRIFEKRRMSADLSYEAVASGWEVRAGGRWQDTQQMSSYMYPYSYSDDLMTGTLFLGGLVKIWKFDLKADMAGSYGRLRNAGRVSEGAAGGETRPFQLTDWYLKQNEFRTAPRLSLEVSLRYNFWKGMYAEISGDYTRAWNLEYISGADRVCCGLSVGYTF